MMVRETLSGARWRADIARERLRHVTALAREGLAGVPGARTLARHDEGVRAARLGWNAAERLVARIVTDATLPGLYEAFTSRGWEVRPYGEGWQAAYRSNVSSRSIAMVTRDVGGDSARLIVHGCVTLAPSGALIEAADEEWTSGWIPEPGTNWLATNQREGIGGWLMCESAWRALRVVAVAAAEATAWRLVAPAALPKLPADVPATVDWYESSVRESESGYEGAIEAHGLRLPVPAFAPAPARR